VLDDAGKLTGHFVGIANIEPKDPTEIRKGYERVIRPRFADAKFFFVEDMKQGLASMNAGLATVTYQAKLGTVADKVARVAALAEAIATDVGADPQRARRAAELAKADLQSRLVGEFPELQGIAGRYYAAVENQPLELAAALDEAYMPRFAGDAIAPSPLGQVLAIAERLDTLAGGFAAGLKPTGNKDPFALRRNALGLARTLLEGGHDVVLHDLVERALSLQPVAGKDIGSYDITSFVYDRLRGYYADRGVASTQFDAVENVAHDSLPDFDRRLNAIGEFAKLPEAEALAAANKRIRNILRKVEGEVPDAIDPALFVEPAERELGEAVDSAVADTDPLLDGRDYVAVLGRLARLRPQVDAFFDGVMVNVDDASIRNNRLALLKRLSERLGSVAAIEHLSM
jgi:glycyl-tRNA synthetase beta chain